MSTPVDPRRDDHGEWDALAVGWALSALEPHDEARFAVHLPTCQRCTATVRETLRTVSDMAYAVPDEAPPAGLKQRIMQAAAAEPRDQAGSSPTGRLRIDDPPPPALDSARRLPEPPAELPEPRTHRHAARDDDRVVPLEPRRRRWASRLAAAAAVVLIAALGAWNYQLRSDNDGLRTVVAQREAAISQLTASGPAKVAVVNDAKVQTIRRATVVVQNGRTSILVENLPPRTGTQTYWLWTLNCDVSNLKAIEGFRVGTQGFSVQNVPSEPGLATAQCFAVSAESKPGTPTTPERVVAVGQLN
jgi:anti-sigma-K factor RskA